MARAEKGERLENEEDLVFDHKTKNHIRKQKLLDFCVVESWSHCNNNNVIDCSNYFGTFCKNWRLG